MESQNRHEKGLVGAFFEGTWSSSSQPKSGKTCLVPHRKCCSPLIIVKKSRPSNATMESAAIVMAAAAIVTGSFGTMIPPALKVAMMPVVAPGSGTSAAGEDGGMLEYMFPGFDTSALVWRISVLQITEYVASLMLGSAGGSPRLCSLYLLGASWGPAITSGAFWRLFSPMMLHANIFHLLFNLIFQLRIGFGMEKQFGRRKFGLLYLSCGVLGNLMSVVANPFKLAVGASTCGFGLLGVWAAEVMLTWNVLGNHRPQILLWSSIMGVCTVLATLYGNTDVVGHLGGAFAGFLVSIILADMHESHRPPWYWTVKNVAKQVLGLLVVLCIGKIFISGPSGPLPMCGTLLHPEVFPL